MRNSRCTFPQQYVLRYWNPIHRMKQVPDQQRTYAALLVAEGSLSAGDTSQHLAHRLIDESNDILAISLDKQVC